MLSQNKRVRYLPRIDSLARKVGFYAAYRIRDVEHVGTIHRNDGVDAVIEFVTRRGYEYNGLAALKWHPETDDSDRGSYRRIAEEHPELDGSPRIYDWEPADCQYHVHLFEGDEPEEIEVYSHYELRPDLFRPSISVERKRIHYRPEYGEEYIRGVACDAIHELVDG